MSAQPADQKLYYPAIDGLRFVAAALVLISHAPPIPGLGVVRGVGFLGVDLFLCISAFLIVRLLRAEYRLTGRIDYRKFYIRRILRIWPLYLGYATAACAFFFLTGAVEMKTFLGAYLSHLLMINNVIVALGHTMVVPLTEHLWTISLEEQAYLIIPFIVGFLCRQDISARTIYRCAVAVVIYLIFCRFVLVLMGTPFQFTYTLLLRADAFVVGLAAAIYVESARVDRGQWAMILGGALLGWAAVTVLGGVGAGGYQTLGYAPVAVGACAMVLACQSPRVSASVLGSAPLRYLDKISYGIYVYHLACISFVQYLLGDMALPNTVQVLVIFAVTIAVAALSYEYFEKRFLRLKEKYAVVKSRAA